MSLYTLEARFQEAHKKGREPRDCTIGSIPNVIKQIRVRNKHDDEQENDSDVRDEQVGT